MILVGRSGIWLPGLRERPSWGCFGCFGRCGVGLRYSILVS